MLNGNSSDRYKDEKHVIIAEIGRDSYPCE